LHEVLLTDIVVTPKTNDRGGRGQLASHTMAMKVLARIPSGPRSRRYTGWGMCNGALLNVALLARRADQIVRSLPTWMRSRSS